MTSFAHKLRLPLWGEMRCKMNHILAAWNVLILLEHLLAFVLFKVFIGLRSLAMELIDQVVHVINGTPTYRVQCLRAVATSSSYQEYNECMGLLRGANSNIVENDGFSIERTDSIVEEDLQHRLISSINGLLELKLTKSASSANIRTLERVMLNLMHRNQFRIESMQADNAANSTSKGLKPRISLETEQVMESYYTNIEEQLEWLAHAPTTDDGAKEGLRDDDDLELRIKALQTMKENLGQTALMMSAGASLALYHLGVVLALIEGGIYRYIKVISGASGGSITAAFCAVHSEDELRELIPVAVSDYTGNGVMPGEIKRQGLRLVPPFHVVVSNLCKTGVSLSDDDPKGLLLLYFQDMTFEEAYQKTGITLLITVSSPNYAAGPDAGLPLLLSHKTTPKVTLVSAIFASCALPMILAPQRLYQKMPNGELEPYLDHGELWVDGSLQVDLPMDGAAQLCGVKNFIVSQVNLNVVPFQNRVHDPPSDSAEWKFFEALLLDMKKRRLWLTEAGYLSHSPAYHQVYSGHVTISHVLTPWQAVGIKAMQHPTEREMEHYLTSGAKAAWPFMKAIQNMIRLEKKLEICLQHLDNRVRQQQKGVVRDFDAVDAALVKHWGYPRLDRQHSLDTSTTTTSSFSSDSDDHVVTDEEGGNRDKIMIS